MEEWFGAAAPHSGVALALALGALIGIERGWTQRLAPDGSRVAGVRTFALLGLTGGLAGEAGRLISPALAAVLVAAAAAAMLIGYARTADRGEVSATTTIVGVLTLGIGVLAATEQGVMASVLAAVITLLLSMRKRIHAWVGELTEGEMHAIARFALISLAVLPLLPDSSFGPYDAWNPRSIWTVVVLVSGLSLAGYAATKQLGASKGVLATVAAGALVSSTAVTASLAARIRSGDGPTGVLIAGIALASMVMLLRVVVLVAILAPFATAPLAVIAIPAALVNVAWLAWGLRRKEQSAGKKAKETSETPSLKNPFDIRPALILAALVAVVSVVGRWAREQFGGAGLVTVLGLSGMLDVDSAIISASALPPGSFKPATAGLIFAAPMVMNTLLKAGLIVGLNRGAGGWAAAAPLLASVIVAVLAGLTLPALFG